MIVRVFRAKVRAGTAEPFEATVRERRLSRVTGAPGMVSYYAGRPLGESGEFVLVTVWEDLDALRAYAGSDWQREAMVPTDELPYLEETMLHHYEVFATST